MDWNDLAYANIETTPLTTINGNATDYLGLEIQDATEEWLPLDKPVTENYLLVQNSEVRDIAQQLVNENNLTVDSANQRHMFNGRQFKLFLPLSDGIERDILPGDPVRSGLMFQNSYDMSMAFGFSVYMERLLCSNGMTGITEFPFVKFKHTQGSADWMDEIFRVSTFLEYNSAFNEIADKMITMAGKHAGYNWFNTNYSKLFSDIPSNLAAPVMANYFKSDDDTLWGLMNAGTDIMWHKKSGNQFASVKHNGTFVNNLLTLC